MTLQELSQLYYLNREIERDRGRLAELRQMAASGVPSYDGMPKSPCADSRIERYVAEIADLELLIQAKIELCLAERTHLERYIAGIADSLTRQIFHLRFVDGLSWRQVAFGVGGGNTAAGVKMICYRHLKKSRD